MTNDGLNRLVSTGESATVEFKKSTAEKERGCRILAVDKRLIALAGQIDESMLFPD